MVARYSLLPTHMENRALYKPARVVVKSSGGHPRAPFAASITFALGLFPATYFSTRLC
jgi:uncharacterized protein (DUF697 family)